MATDSGSTMTDFSHRNAFLNLHPESDLLVISFEGMLWDQYDWGGPAERFDVNWLGCKDPRNGYYHFGIEGISEGIDDTTDWLLDQIEQINPGRIVTIGGSGGGYAAILFGWFLDVDAVLGFNPRIFLDRANRDRTEDSRGAAVIDKVLANPSHTPDYLDLHRVLGHEMAGRATHEFHYSHLHPIDRAVTEECLKFPSVSVVPHQESKHLLWRLMDSDKMDRILESFLGLKSKSS